MADTEKYYRSMLNGLYGIMDDLDANHAPDSAKELLVEIIDICKLDFEEKFPNAVAGKKGC